MQFEFFRYQLHLKHRFATAHGSSDSRGILLVKLTHEGMTGWGEAAPNSRYGETSESALTALRAMTRLLPADPLAYAPAIASFQAWPGGDFAARAALDAAVLDWVGQALGQPLYRLWGLDPSQAPPTDMTIGMDRPEVMAAHAREARSFAALKIKLGGDDDRAMIRAIRQAVDTPLRVDANEGWTDRERALRDIEWLAAHGVALVEQPMPADRHADMVWLKARSPLPLIADEAFTRPADLPRLAEAFHGVNVKLAKLGGLLAARDAIAAARVLGLKTFLGCMVESALGIAAAAQISALADWVDLDGFLLTAGSPFSGPELREGRVVPAGLPGLGVAPTPELAAAKRVS